MLYLIIGYLMFGFIMTGFIVMLDMMVMMSRPPDWEAMRNAQAPKKGALSSLFLKGMFLWPYLLWIWVQATWYKRTLNEQVRATNERDAKKETIQKVGNALTRITDWPPTKKMWVKDTIVSRKNEKLKLYLHILQLPSGFRLYTHAIVEEDKGRFSCWRFMVDKRLNLSNAVKHSKRLAKKSCEEDDSWMILCHPLMIKKQLEAWRLDVKFLQDNGYPLPFDLDEANQIADEVSAKFDAAMERLKTMGSPIPTLLP